MQGIIGKKVGMTRLFDAESGEVVPVSVIQTGENIVTQVKTTDKDGYAAIQLGFGHCSEKCLTNPVKGHLAKAKSPMVRHLKEFGHDTATEESPQAGAKIGPEILEHIKFVDVQGISKGRGFSGTIRRHNFQRGRETHGNTNHRAPGSIGCSAYPARVFPGKRMAGQYGNAKVTVKGLKVVGINKEEGLVYIKGATPGRNKGLLYITKNISKKK